MGNTAGAVHQVWRPTGGERELVKFFEAPSRTFDIRSANSPSVKAETRNQDERPTHQAVTMSSVHFCGRCGAPNDITADFCANCGAVLELPVESPFQQEPSAPPTRPIRTSRSGVLWVIPLVIVLLAGGIIAGLVLSRGSPSIGESATTDTTTADENDDLATVMPQETTTTTSTTSLPAATRTTTSLPPQPPNDIFGRVDFDRSRASQLVETWVPMLSQKWYGLRVDGIFFDENQVLQLDQSLRNEYGSIVLWSGDYSSFHRPDMWVHVVPMPFYGKSGALDWCRASTRTRADCGAKLISRVQGSKGSTAWLP